jgi:hypothetical protein
MAKESVLAAIRMKPEILVVASKEGTALIRSLLSDQDWRNSSMLGIDVPIQYVNCAGTEVIALEFQLVRTRYSNAKIHRAIGALRAM